MGQARERLRGAAFNASVVRGSDGRFIGKAGGGVFPGGDLASRILGTLDRGATGRGRYPAAAPPPAAAPKPGGGRAKLLAGGARTRMSGTGETPAKVAASPGSDVHSRIHAAYAALAHEPGGYVSLADLREHPQLRGISRAEVDQALTRIGRGDFPHGDVTQETNQKALTQRDREAALQIGGQPAHTLHFTPGYRPAARAAAPAKGAARAKLSAGFGGRLVNTLTPTEAVNRLRAAGSIDQAQAYLVKATKADLTAIAQAAGVQYGASWPKPRILRELIQHTAGRRLDAAVISRPR